MMTRPLVSFCVKCYNQSAYIGEALDGAFAQTYRPIEYVIADDASTDGSFKIILDKLAAAGFVEDERGLDESSDRIVRRFVRDDTDAWLIQNRRNRGNCGNWQVLCAFAHGELFVKADGDDISLPQRTQRVVDEWHKAGPKCGMIYHNAIKIDEKGKEIGTADKEVFEIKHTLGAVMACTRACYDRFGNCADAFAYDDIVYHRRGMFWGLTEHRFDEKLVKYRIGSGESTRGKSYAKTMHKNVQISARSLECAVSDLRYLQQQDPKSCISQFLSYYENEWKRRLAELSMWESDSIRERWRAFRLSHPHIELNCNILVHTVLLLPRRFATRLLDFLYTIRQ